MEEQMDPSRFEDPVSYSTTLRRLKQVAKFIGIKDYGLHSSRKGAATTFVKASSDKGADFTDRLLRSAGRWAKGSTSAGKYIDEIWLMSKSSQLLSRSFNAKLTFKTSSIQLQISSAGMIGGIGWR